MTFSPGDVIEILCADYTKGHYTGNYWTKAYVVDFFHPTLTLDIVGGPRTILNINNYEIRELSDD